MPTSFEQKKQRLEKQKHLERERRVSKLVTEMLRGVPDGYEDECVDITQVVASLEPKIYQDETLDWQDKELVRDKRRRRWSC